MNTLVVSIIDVSLIHPLNTDMNTILVSITNISQATEKLELQSNLAIVWVSHFVDILEQNFAASGCQNLGSHVPLI